MSVLNIITKNNEQISTSFEAMKKSETIKALLMYVDDEPEDFDISILENPLPLPQVDTCTLKLIIKYCQYHYDNKDTEDDKKKWDKEFIKMDDDKLFNLILASNYLEIKPLLDLTCSTVADYIKECHTPQEIRRRFNIKNDFTPEEEEEVRKENAWCEEK